MSANSISKMWIEPAVKTTPEAQVAREGRRHSLCPRKPIWLGLGQFLPLGIKEALAKSKPKNTHHKLDFKSQSDSRLHSCRIGKYLKIYRAGKTLN